MHRIRSNLFVKTFSTKLNSITERIKQEIDFQEDEYFDSVPIEEYQEYLLSKFKINDFPIINWEEIEVSIGEIEVNGSDLPNLIYVHDPNKKYKKKLVTFSIPIEGNTEYLQFHPSNIISTSSIYGTLSLNSNTLTVAIIDYQNLPEIIEGQFKRTQKTITERMSYLNNELEKFHSELPIFIESNINGRLKKISSTNSYISKFSYPVRKKDVPTTFEFPRLIKKQKIKPKPVVIKGVESNERFITQEDYMRILAIFQDCGKNWEHFPRTYQGKGEEDLRDLLIFVLSPNIEAVVAGEAYNKKGKTDIAIKYESTNLFIGECKIWRGPKILTKTIDQILGYLTWRDSKAAIMLFVPNQEISHVITEAHQTICNHPNFIRVIDEINEGWINYRIHLENDEGTFLTLAVQLYHLPDL